MDMSLSPPPGIDISANQGPRIVKSGVVLIILPTIFVILRFVSRISARAGFWWDDFLIVLCLLLSYGTNIAIMISPTTNGLGKHLWALDDPPNDTRKFLLILYIYVIIYYVAVVCIKLCIIIFYRRIFPVTEIRIWLYISYSIVTGYAIATLLVTTFQCQPIHGFWDKMIPSHCIQGDNVLIVPGAVNAVLDAYIIFLPIPLLWRLRTSSSQKGVLTGIFACAAFVCVISIVRLVVLGRLENKDVTWNYVDAAIWSTAEPAMGIIAACIPSLRPLFAIVWKGSYRGPTMNTKGTQATNSSTPSKMIWPSLGSKDESDPAGGFTRLEEPTGGRWGHDTNIHGGLRGARGIEGDKISLEEMNVPPGGIIVKNEITITTQAWDYNDKVF